jgi:hypothetical protein
VGRTLLICLAILGHINPILGMCDIFIARQEKACGIPQNLLKAISLRESGKKVGRSMVAWPWTINVNGIGYTYSSKEEAINAVENFRKKGAKSIDVGCMQINLKHHPLAFRNLSEAFDPQTNVMYAANFLGNLKNQYGSWFNAVAHYHSASPRFHTPYRQGVIRQWETLRRQYGIKMPALQDVSFVGRNPNVPLIQNAVIKNDTKEDTEKKPPLIRFSPYQLPSSQNEKKPEGGDQPASHIIQEEPISATLPDGFIPLAHKLAKDEPRAKVKKSFIRLDINKNSSGFIALR